jgi:type I restriction enzyme S subunit
VYYQLCNIGLNKYAKGGGQPLVTAGQIKQVEIPVPTIDVQNKIVEILDRFDALCSDISAGLPAEIEARQKQYEYYRDKLLNFKEMSE